MSVYAIEIGERTIAVFNAASKREAEGQVLGSAGLAEDLNILESEEGIPIWNGADKITVRLATPIEYNRWQLSRSMESDETAERIDQNELTHLVWFVSVYDPTDVDL